MIETRWIGHLLGALSVGVILIIVWEQYAGMSISRMAEEIFSQFGVGTGLMIAILVILALLIWAKSASG